MNVKRWVGLAFLLALCPLALACGDGSDKAGGNQTSIASETPAAGAAKADIEMIPGKAFDRSVLTVAADREVAITANNTDGLHSFAVFAGEEYESGLVEPIARTEACFAPCTVTLTVNLTPGEYFFRCQVHPEEMVGTLIAQQGLY